MSRERRRRPVVIEGTGKDGQKVKAIGCPFCKPPHPLDPNGTPSTPCGTYLSVQAVQNIYFEQGLKCIVCGNTGGTLIKVGENYRHIHDCVPGKKMYTQAPRMTKRAAVAWRLPRFMQKAFGIVPVEIQDDKGKVLGYSFDKP